MKLEKLIFSIDISSCKLIKISNDELKSDITALEYDFFRFVLLLNKNIFNGIYVWEGFINHYGPLIGGVYSFSFYQIRVLNDHEWKLLKINAYTIGNKSSYDKSLIEENSPKKLGAYLNYEGGWAWSTEKEARSFLKGNNGPNVGIINKNENRMWKKCDEERIDFGDGPIKCDVYGLILPNLWNNCVSQNRHQDGVHRLLVDAELVSLDW